MSTEVAGQITTEPSQAAWDAIRGAYDLQVHVAPDVIARRIDDVGLAQEFLDRGLKGFVLKSHYVPTAERAKVVTRAIPGIQAFGGLTLNHSIGGFNPVAVEIAGRSGAKIVWMPTVDAANETAGLPGGNNAKLPFWADIQRELASEGIAPPPLSPIDANGVITAPARACLERIAKHQMILATGHLGRGEIFAVVREAKILGIQKIIITHAEFPSQNLSAIDQVGLIEMGAVIEHCFTTTHTGKAAWSLLFANIRTTGVERTILATDLGQTINPAVSVGFALYAQHFLDAGFSADEVRHMAVTLPAQLIQD